MTERPADGTGSAPPGRDWGRYAWLLPASLAASLVARCVIISGKLLLFGDEFITWYPASASFSAMLASTSDTINTSPPLYFILTWFWAHAFGNSALSLRLFSSLAACVAVVAMFQALKRAYGPLAAASAVTVAFFNVELLAESMEARFYMLVLAEVAAAILIYQCMMDSPRSSKRLLVANTAVHACLVMTHYFGLLYSGLVLGAVLLTSLRRGRRSLRECASIAAGWIVFLPWIPVLQRHLGMGRPSFWIPVPAVADVGRYYAGFLTPDFWILAAILCGLGLAAVARGRRGPGEAAPVPSMDQGRSLLTVGILFGLFPILVYVVSTRHGAPSSFLARYMIPCWLGWSIIVAHIASRIFGMGAKGNLGLAQVAAVVLFMGWCESAQIADAGSRIRQGPPAMLPAAVKPGEPVVVEYIHEFMALHFYSPESPRYVFLVDHEAAIKAGGGVPANHQVMEALKRNFPDQFKEVIPSGEFLAGAQSFWVLIHNLEWWPARIPHNPDFVSDAALPDQRLVHVVRRH